DDARRVRPGATSGEARHRPRPGAPRACQWRRAGDL
ncbi:MAG: hypothetical protein AVDCRST_MAG34-2238, partial [uncultured Nocardioidaceae bacterium]